MVKFYEVLMKLYREILAAWKQDRTLRAYIEEVFSVEGLEYDHTDDLMLPKWADKVIDHTGSVYTYCSQALVGNRISRVLAVYYIYRQACNTYMMFGYLVKAIEQEFDPEFIKELTEFVEQSKDISSLSRKIESLSSADRVIFSSYLNQY